MTDIMTEDPGGDPSARGSRARFAQGGRGDQAKPGAWQLLMVNGASGPDGSCPDTTCNEALGLLGQWDTAACWVESRKLAVARELIRRYAIAGAVPGPPGGAPSASPPGLPAAAGDDLAREVSLQLGMSIPAARSLLHLAGSLEARLPGVGQALAEGRIKPGPVRMLAEETDVLDNPALLAEAERMILDGLRKCFTGSPALSAPSTFSASPRTSTCSTSPPPPTASPASAPRTPARRPGQPATARPPPGRPPRGQRGRRRGRKAGSRGQARRWNRRRRRCYRVHGQ